jgi:hypothetical protein
MATLHFYDTCVILVRADRAMVWRMARESPEISRFTVTLQFYDSCVIFFHDAAD